MILLYEQKDAAFVELLNAVISADDCGTKDPCFQFEGSLEYDPKPNAVAYDLRLQLKGTYRNASGRIAPIPPAPIVLRFDKDHFVPVTTTQTMRVVWEATQNPW
jgi:hypothetical protein